MSKIRVAHLFTDVPNGGASGADYDNGIWEHVLGVERVPLEKGLTDGQIGKWCEVNNIDVLIATMWGTFVGGYGKPQRGMLTIREECPDLKIIGLVDEPLMVDWAHRYGGTVDTVKQAQGYLDGLGDFDHIMTISRHEDKFYSHKGVPATFVGLPFPDKTYPSLVRSNPRPEKGNQIWVGLGVGGTAHTRWERNYGVSLAAFEAAVELVRAEDPDTADRMRGIMLSWSDKSNQELMLHIKDRYPNVMIQQRQDMQTFLHFLQSCDACISTILRDTPGRLVGECAFFGVPLYGSDVPDIQTELWGKEMSFTPWDVMGYAHTVADQILCGHTKDEQCATARQKLIELYGMDRSKERFKAILRSMDLNDEWVTQEDQAVLV
jgi:hypothetical protein